MKTLLSRHTLPCTSEQLEPTLSWLEALCRQNADLPEEERNKLIQNMKETLEVVIENSRQSALAEPLVISVQKNCSQFDVEIHNKGEPLYPDSDFNHRGRTKQRPLPASLTWRNLGRQGQLLSFSVPMRPEKASVGEVVYQSMENVRSLEDVTIRALEDGEEAALSRLFFHVYGYNYINEAVYYPQLLARMRDRSDLESYVAVSPQGEIIGHVGLVRKNVSPLVFEAAMGVVDPACKVKGVFKTLFAHVMKRVHEIPMHYCFFDFVTNHELSQRSVNHYGNVDMALLIGCQRKDTQARLAHLGLGSDPETMDRYSLLCGLVPRVPHPFGKTVSIPGSGGELLGFLLKPLGLEWTPRSRFDALDAKGSYSMEKNSNQNSVAFDMNQPGRAALGQITSEWELLLREGYLYASVVVPLDAPGIGQVYDELSRCGFFIAGFLPYRFSDRLALVMQSVGPARVAWEHIRVHSEGAKRLLELVKTNHQRARLL